MQINTANLKNAQVLFHNKKKTNKINSAPNKAALLKP